MDGKKIRNPSYRIKEGQTLQLPQFLFSNEEQVEQFQMEPKELSEVYSRELKDSEKALETFKKMIIYEDSSLIAINKPAGFSS